MTHEEQIEAFLDLLVLTQGKGWYLSNNGGKMRDAGHRCPICSLCHTLDPSVRATIFPDDAFMELGMSVDERYEKNFLSAKYAIMQAADNYSAEGNLRARLLVAIGLGLDSSWDRV